MGFGHIFLILFLFLFTACSAEHDGASDESSTNTGIILNPNPDPALEAAAAAILGPKCLSCHGSSGTEVKFLGNVSTPIEQSLKENTRYVRIGQGAISSLFMRSNDGTMPPGNPLTSQEAEDIKAWIDDLGIVPDNTEEEDPAATFSEIETNILAPKCYGCHDGHGTYDFGDYSDVLFGFVAPFNLSSTLYTSVTAGASSTGNVMPKNQTPLSPAEIAAIESWIMDGAQNN